MIINIKPPSSASEIQKALKSGNTINFAPGTYSAGALTFVSNIIWNAKNAIFKNISITNSGTINNVKMNGGTYSGSSSRLIELVSKNCNYSDLTIEVISGSSSQHGFGLQKGSTGNKCNRITANHAALADKSQDKIGNEWTDCTYNGDSGTIDGFIIKCKNSTFTRCIVNKSKVAGFGFYAKDDTSDKGIEVSNNKFIDCEAYDNGHAGFSLNCPSNGPNAHIHDNSIQGIATGNKMGGLSFVNNSPGGKNENNTFDILSHDNPGGGLNIEKGCNNNSGSIVAYNNEPNDINNNSSGNKINLYHPLDQKIPKISGVGVTTTDFDCKTYPIPTQPPFCIVEYCGTTPTPTPPPTLSVDLTISPSVANMGTPITFKATPSGGNPPYIYTWSGSAEITDTIICQAQSTGTFIAQIIVTDSQGNKASAQSQYTVNQ